MAKGVKRISIEKFIEAWEKYSTGEIHSYEEFGKICGWSDRTVAKYTNLLFQNGYLPRWLFEENEYVTLDGFHDGKFGKYKWEDGYDRETDEVGDNRQGSDDSKDFK